MPIVRWSEPTQPVNIAGTALNNLSPTTPVTMPVQIDNRTAGTARNLYIVFQLALGSVTPTANAFIRLRMMRDIGGGVYPDRSSTVFSGGLQFDIPMIASVGARVYETDRLLLPGPWLFGVEIINNSGVTLAASGNQLNYQMFGEEA